MLDWSHVTSSFRVLAARDLLAMTRFERHQDVRSRLAWLNGPQPPLALLFISHRWETLAHPDPSGRQLRSIQAFLRQLSTCLEALLVPKDQRLRRVPRLDLEGTLQAAEVARRLLGFGPFSRLFAGSHGAKAREVVRAEFEARAGNGFGDWLMSRIGLWLDYTCMPQKPLAPEDVPEFRRSLEALDDLVASSIVIALRQPGDDYSVRGWCATEFFLASGKSFARGLFVDIDRLRTDDAVALSPPPTPASPESAVMQEAHAADLAAFQRACEAWTSIEVPLVDATPPDAWSAYRDLQGSSFHSVEQDSNPFRRVMEAIRSLETYLVETWLMAGETHTVDVGTLVRDLLTRHGLHCSESDDLVYLGLLLPGRGWIEAFKPLFRECLRQYLARGVRPGSSAIEEAHRTLRVTLEPLDGEVRGLFAQLEPDRASVWQWRLSVRSGLGNHEKAVVDQFRRSLEATPPRFAIEPAP